MLFLLHLTSELQMNLNIRRMFPFAVCIFSAAQLLAESSAPVTLIKSGRLLDPRSGNILSPAAVLIENDRINEVGSPQQVQAHAPADAKTIDLGPAMLLPG